MRKTRRVLAWLAVFCMIFTMHQNTVVSYATEAPAEQPAVDEAAANGFSIDNTGTLVGYSGVGGDVVIPSTVTSIAANAFAGNTSITSVTIPASVALFGSGIFANCTSLTTVTIQGNISSIPTQTFYNCANLRNVYVPASVTAIGSEAFAECVSLSGITLPGGVATIADRAFYDCASLSGVSIPATVSSIGSNAFAGCVNMTSYSVDGSNGYYASSGGCLYNKTMTKLLSCPEGRSSVTIADGTKIIGSNAFANCKAIRSLVLPNSVTTIESNAFAGSGIRDITIMAGVTSIGSQGSWTADIIYGEANSAAQTYANSNSIVFQALSSSTPPQDTEDPGEGNTEGGGGNKKPNGGGTTPGSTGGDGTGTTPNGNEGSTGGSAGSGQATTTVRGGTTVAASSVSHEKDTTPKTGDGINPVFFFCLAFMLVGVSLLAVGKRRALQRRR